MADGTAAGIDATPISARPSKTAHKHGGLAELPATAICGNDITSSCLYVSALAIMAAGQWAWLSLLIVAAVLYLFRGRTLSWPIWGASPAAPISAALWRFSSRWTRLSC